MKLSAALIIVALVVTLAAGLPILAIYIQWLVDNFSSGVLFWVMLIGMAGVIGIPLIAANLIGRKP